MIKYIVLIVIIVVINSNKHGNSQNNYESIIKQHGEDQAENVGEIHAYCVATFP